MAKNILQAIVPVPSPTPPTTPRQRKKKEKPANKDEKAFPVAAKVTPTKPVPVAVEPVSTPS